MALSDYVNKSDIFSSKSPSNLSTSNNNISHNKATYYNHKNFQNINYHLIDEKLLSWEKTNSIPRWIAEVSDTTAIAAAVLSNAFEENVRKKRLVNIQNHYYDDNINISLLKKKLKNFEKNHRLIKSKNKSQSIINMTTNTDNEINNNTSSNSSLSLNEIKQVDNYNEYENINDEDNNNHLIENKKIKNTISECNYLSTCNFDNSPSSFTPPISARIATPNKFSSIETIKNDISLCLNKQPYQYYHQKGAGKAIAAEAFAMLSSNKTLLFRQTCVRRVNQTIKKNKNEMEKRKMYEKKRLMINRQLQDILITKQRRIINKRLHIKKLQKIKIKKEMEEEREHKNKLRLLRDIKADNYRKALAQQLSIKQKEIKTLVRNEILEAKAIADWKTEENVYKAKKMQIITKKRVVEALRQHNQVNLIDQEIKKYQNNCSTKKSSLNDINENGITNDLCCEKSVYLANLRVKKKSEKRKKLEASLIWSVSIDKDDENLKQISNQKECCKNLSQESKKSNYIYMHKKVKNDDDESIIYNNHHQEQQSIPSCINNTIINIASKNKISYKQTKEKCNKPKHPRWNSICNQNSFSTILNDKNTFQNTSSSSSHCLTSLQKYNNCDDKNISKNKNLISFNNVQCCKSLYKKTNSFCGTSLTNSNTNNNNNGNTITSLTSTRRYSLHDDMSNLLMETANRACIWKVVNNFNFRNSTRKNSTKLIK